MRADFCKGDPAIDKLPNKSGKTRTKDIHVAVSSHRWLDHREQ